MLIDTLQSKNENKAPIVLTDSAELGDKRLDPTEALIKIKAENNARAQKQTAIPDQKMMTDRKMAIGTPMPYQSLVYLLKKMSPSLVIEDGGVRNAIAVRIPGICADGTRGLIYCSGFYKEVLPEFSCVQEDERGRPTRECRGWRTVVLALIRQGHISYKDAVSVFGEPNGIRAGRWQQLLREQRA